MDFAVINFLNEYLPDLIDFQFTAQMEERLDKIAEGEAEWAQILRDFYAPFKQTLDRAAVDHGGVYD